LRLAVAEIVSQQRNEQVSLGSSRRPRKDLTVNRLDEIGGRLSGQRHCDKRAILRKLRYPLRHDAIGQNRRLQNRRLFFTIGEGVLPRRPPAESFEQRNGQLR